jgi:anaerobic magnesium-protoporphyrin IX monomethyl ester cyclase
MARILLIQPPLSSAELFARGSKTSASVLPPLGLAYIAATLRKHGHECRIIDGIAESFSLDALIEMASQYDLVGITVVSTYAMRAIELIQKFKESPSCPPIVVGGHHVTAEPESLLRFGADYAVVGEGEITMSELVECLSSKTDGSSVRQVQGIGFIENGEYIFSGNRQKIDPLDQLPLPARDLLPMHLYRSSVARGNLQPSHSMLTSRGCPGVCSFCSKKTFGTKVRYFSVGRIVEEFFLLRDQYGARGVSIFDDNFLSNHQVVHEVCEELCNKNFGITWSVEARIDCVNREILQCLRKAGCAYIAYGIESGSQRILDYINKRISKDQVREIVRITKEVGIPIRGYFMMGFPSETKEDIEATIRFAIELDLDVASFTLFVPFPATREYERAKKRGIFDPDYYKKIILPEFNFLDLPVYVPEGFTPSSLLELHRSAYNRYYLRPKILWRRFSSLRSLDDLKAIH